MLLTPAIRCDAPGIGKAVLGDLATHGSDTARDYLVSLVAKVTGVGVIETGSLYGRIDDDFYRTAVHSQLAGGKRLVAAVD